MAAPARRLQLTLALLKPDAVAHPLVREAVHAAILRHRFLIVRAKELRCGAEQSRRFYREHAGRFFYQRLVEFMASGPMWAYILAHEDAVPLWRSLMGPTKVFRARHSDPDSIRGAYGLTDTRNTTHGSDSAASASREIAFFFPEFDEQRWYEQEEPRLRRGQLFYSAQERVHRVLGAQPAQVPGRACLAGLAAAVGTPLGSRRRAVLPFRERGRGRAALCCLGSDYWCNRMLGYCRSSPCSAHADSLAMQLTGPLSLFGCEQGR